VADTDRTFELENDDRLGGKRDLRFAPAAMRLLHAGESCLWR
jgi:hypothetical protein